MTDDERLQFRLKFRLVCLTCGSENVAVDFDPGREYSELTQDPASFSVGCNACGENDFFAYG